MCARNTAVQMYCYSAGVGIAELLAYAVHMETGEPIEECRYIAHYTKYIPLSNTTSTSILIYTSILLSNTASTGILLLSIASSTPHSIRYIAVHTLHNTCCTMLEVPCSSSLRD
jgi:hypothetical protein